MYSSNVKAIDWHEQAHKALLKGNYFEAIKLYETAIEDEPEQKYYYWNLGLLLLLDGKEEEAQTTWLFAMTDGTDVEVEEWTADLLGVLDTEAKRQEQLQDHTVAWAIRQHIREISPTNLINLLYLIQLSIKLENYNSDEIISYGAIELLESDIKVDIDSETLMETLRQVLNYNPLDSYSLKLAKACISHVKNNKTFIKILLQTAFRVSVLMYQPNVSAKFAELGLELEPDNTDVLIELATVYQNAGETDRGIEVAKKNYSLSDNLPDKIYANYMILRGLIYGAHGNSQQVNLFLERQKSLLTSLFELQPMDLTQATTMRLFSTPFFFPYVRDDPETNKYLNQQVAQICQKNILRYGRSKLERLREQYPHIQNINPVTKTLKIGYLSHCLKTHSVGWLARWLFHYRNRDKFEVYAYLINSKGRNDILQNWYVEQVDQAHQFSPGSHEIIDRIYEDKLDILVDLDSITLDVSCEIMSIKHAPVQITWLGWDASELPSIDYFIADPYVLPENAQDYYSETIWRLPQTYIAVDGFEVGISTVRRDILDIPSDAVIYLSAQTGYKHNSSTAYIQMQILKEVPNSYFLIKDLVTNSESVQAYFAEIAAEIGVNPDRLRHMPMVPTSQIHRANLAIADVVLDTYPYNGATTTMETLWMCIPMVTRVGQQFAARNSYTMMMNAGITEGIAWSDEEYVEWGIRLGKDEKLRQEISWKLRKSRQTAPLWNAKQFTREMEKAYEQMWQRYIKGGS
ncbi:O-linked N-acetylglucosamine transferase, SPINDLY family protein [Okeania sp. SIO1I7]|uniref:O-linked N-acetylglucosamine transferase, SPINDLY family protein n=1 Tax=Okeania sp. SIO1I7 TaxID=2607772 RepID=UPI0013FA1B84|nr:O-linked N-acetylglucosamine transferase, SPINDLY family protein [Okeania sp. SIO1I7]NET28206.1 O-linked N-acetylglucosamine transferase, SPINDLY family protein [Okeania sp. SIO1I7]